MAATQGIRAGRAFVELGVNDRLTAGLRRAQRRLRAFGDQVQSIGQRLVGISAAAATPFALSGAAFATFEQSMARVRALTGATAADFARLSDAAKRLGESTVFSASQASDAMGFFALAGFDVEQILKSIGPTLNLAAAGQLEIAEAADIAAKIMSGMGLEAERLGDAVDVLTKAMTTANTDLGMLGAAMKFVGPIAKTAGVQFEELVAAIQLLSNAGIQGEMAGTTLRGAILALTSPSKEAADTLAELGVRVLDSQGNVRSLADIIGDLNRAMAGLGSGQRLEILGRIFQARQAAGIAELLNQGADRLRDFTDALEDAGGTAARIAGVQLNTLKGQLTILKSALEGLGIAIGESIAGPLRVAAFLLGEAAAAAARWVRENRSAVVIAGASIAIVAGLGAGLLALGIAIKTAAFAVGGLATALALAKTLLVGVSAAIAALASPVGLAVAAVAALGTSLLIWSGAGGEALAWLRDQFGRLRDFVGKVTAGISDALAAGDVRLAAEILWLSLKLAWQQGVAELNGVWLAARNFFVTTAQRMWFGAVAAAQIGFHALEVGWIETTAFLSKTWTRFATGVKKVWESATSFIAKRMLEIQGLFDDSLDVEAAKRAVDEELDARLSELDSAVGRDIAARESKRERDRRAADELNEATLAEIGRQFEEAQDALRAGSEEQIARTQEALEEARRKLDEAIAEARRRRDEREQEAPGDGPRSPADVISEIDDQLESLGSRIARGVDVRGTFSAAAVAGLSSSGNAVERAARASEQTAKNTRRLVDAARTGGLTFA